MNSFRPDASPVTWIWGLVLLHLLLAAGDAPVAAPPNKPLPKTDDAKASPSPAPSPSPSPDPLASTPKDLLLSPDDEKKAGAMADFIQGEIAEDNADVDSALDSYRKVLAVDPTAQIRTEDGGDTLMLLSAKVGFELARGGDPSAGIDLLKDTIKAAPKNAMAYFFVSQLYEKYLRKYDIALKYAEQALDLDPDNFAFYVANYELQLDLGQTKKAGAILERASKMQKNDPQHW